MRKIKNGIAIPFTILILVACSQQIYHSLNWQTSQIKVDGTPTEWQIPLKHYDKSSNLNYEFRNDSKYLYFAARTAKQSTIQTIMHSGLKLELDTMYGNNSYPFSLTYPVMQGPPQMGSLQNEDKRQDFNTLQNFGDMSDAPNDIQNKNSFQLPNNEITLKGFNGIEQDSLTVPFTGANGIYAQCFTDSEGICFYEVVIPFETFYKPTISATDTTQVFSCKITIQSMGGGGMPPQGGMGAPPSGGMNSGGMSGGGMGGPPPGGMGGGPGGGPGMQGGPSTNSQSGNNSFKIKENFCLSYQ